jgi:hypothetical protein
LQDYGEKIIVSLLKLDLLSSAETMDGDQYYSGGLRSLILFICLILLVLLRMVGSIVLNEANLKTYETPICPCHVLTRNQDYASRLQAQGPEVIPSLLITSLVLTNGSNLIACKILDELIMTRLLAAGNKDWLEKATITRTWLATKDEDADDLLDGLRGLFDGVMRNTKTAFSAPATHAAQTVSLGPLEVSNPPAYVTSYYGKGSKLPTPRSDMQLPRIGVLFLFTPYLRKPESQTKRRSPGRFGSSCSHNPQAN